MRHELTTAAREVPKPQPDAVDTLHEPSNHGSKAACARFAFESSFRLCIRMLVSQHGQICMQSGKKRFCGTTSVNIAVRPRLPIMQGLRSLSRAVLRASQQSQPLLQLPELGRWHAEFVSQPVFRDAVMQRQSHRCFASVPLSTGKERVVVLGTGWAAARLTKDLNCSYYDITVSCTTRPRRAEIATFACVL